MLFRNYSIFARCLDTETTKARMAYQPIAILCLMLMISLNRACVCDERSCQGIDPRVLCTRNLARVIVLLCYDDVTNEKRSETGTMYSTILSQYYEEQTDHNWAWVPRNNTRSLGLPPHGKRFIISKCCDKPYSVQELLPCCEHTY